MIWYVCRRLAWTIVVLWAIATLTFGAIFLSPVDPAHVYAGSRASEQVVEQVREDFGLNDSIAAQYGRYMERLVQGDLGTSFFTGKPVLTSTIDRLPRTILLAGAAALVMLALGIPMGIIAALRPRSLVDRFIMGFSLVGAVIPTFVLGLLLLYFLAFKLDLFPLGGSGSFSHLVLPALTLGIPGAAWYARMLRSTILNITSEDYVRNARAKGMPQRIVVGRHVMRNAIGPIVTMIALDLGVFFGGVLVIEKVFGWPGLGELAWRAVGNNDIPVIMGTVLIAACFIVLLNLVADLVNAAVDPRVAYT